MQEKKEKETSLLWRIVRGILIAVLILVLLFSAIGLWYWKTRTEYESTAVPYLESVVLEITTWDPEILWSHFNEDLRPTIDRDDYDKVMVFMSTLGSLETLGHPEFQQVTSSASTEAGANTFVYYQIPAKFERGDATINVTLVDRDGVFSIANFKVNSMAFTEGEVEDSADSSTNDE